MNHTSMRNIMKVIVFGSLAALNVNVLVLLNLIF
jgi:hypothetical protein